MTEEENIARMDFSRKPRREAVQIYRPGMFKKGVDATLSGEPPSGSLPPEAPKKTRVIPSPLSGARSTGRIDQVHRRRSNDTESIHSYRNDSGSTTPDAASISSERRNSGGRGGGMRTFTRGAGRSRERYNDSTSECSVQSYVSTSSRNDRNDARNNYRRGHNNENNAYNGYNKPYNSTQSLYNSRIPGGYLDSSEGRQRPLKQNFPNVGSRFTRNGPSNERSSMRAETGQRRVPRRRNDSVNSTQSEWPQPTQELMVDTGPETQSQAGDALSANSVDYFAVCQSLESMGSFNWTEEMEQVDLAKQHEEEEEEETKHLQKKIQACKNGVELQKTLNENKGRPIRGIMRINIEDGPPSWAKPTEKQQSPREYDRPPPHPKGRRDRRGGRRQRKDSDCSSSVTGSIVEEEENDDELDSGQRTPTDSRPSSSQGNRYNRHERKSSRDKDYYNRPRTEPTDRALPNRLAGRLSTANGININRIEPRGVYQPPAMRRAADAIGSSSSLKSNRDSQDTMSPKVSKEEQIYNQIAQDQGPQIEKLNQAIGALLPQVADKKDVKSAEQLLKLSEKLRTVYIDVLTKDISFTFSKNLEQHLWKQAFHKIIDAMKRASNSVNNNAKIIREILSQFIDDSIGYYLLLISHLETTFDVSFELALYWPNGLPTDDFSSLLNAEKPVLHDSSNQKLALKSLSRHLLCLGDLYRYKSLVEGNEDYSAARAWYLKAALLWPSSGHTYNQLAVVAFFSMLYTSTRRARYTPLEILSKQRQERVLDEIFFCIRAIGAGHPYEAAKDRLNARLAAMRKKVEKYEVLLDSEQGRIKTELVHIDFDQREHWILPETEKHVEEPSTSTANSSQLHRRAVSYLIHTSGLLISKIGMETFASVSERAFSQLNQLLALEEVPISSHQLIQFSLVFIYAVHATAIKDTLAVQQQYAVEALITYFGVLLKHIEAEAIPSWFNGSATLSKQAHRVLPPVSVISSWLQSSVAAQIFKDMPSLQALKFTDLRIDTWSYLANIANAITQIESEDGLATIVPDSVINSYIQPELLYLSSFLRVFPNKPNTFGLHQPEDTKADISTHVRVRSLIQVAKFLAELHVTCIHFEETSCKYVKVEPEANHLVFTRSEENKVSDGENLSRDEFLARERQRRVLLVIKPRYVVPDTNALVDHLELFQRIANSDRYEILIPTIVLDELQGLSKPGIDTRSEKISIEAKKCLMWFKEKVKEKATNMHTLTTQGNKIAFRIMTEETDDRGTGNINDDRILQSCTNYINRNPAIPFPNVIIPKGTEAIYSNLVLLSEDRGICIKATSAHVPTRTIQHFVKWSKTPS